MTIASWLHGALLWVHIDAGIIAILSGATAAVARKGGRLHARAGLCFVGSMLVLGGTATILFPLKQVPESGLAGFATCYLVLTAWMTARRKDGTTGTFEIGACCAAAALAVAMALEGFAETTTPIGGPMLALAAFILLAGVGDLKAILREKVTPAQRLSRHVWRICLGFFLATGSFFIGQQNVMPEAARGSPVLIILGVAPLVVMLFWLVRLRFPKATARLRSGRAGVHHNPHLQA